MSVNDDFEAAEHFVEAMIAEAAEFKIALVRLTAFEDCIRVYFSDAGGSTERDQIPVRFWHPLLSSIHSLISDRSTSGEKDFPGLNRLKLPCSLSWLALRKVSCKEIELEFEFSQASIVIELSFRD